MAFEDWIGRVEEAEDSVPLHQARALAATLDYDADTRAAMGLADGGSLPALWHWIAFLPDAPMSGLDTDGHPRRGGFLPPIPLERRMWAGGRLTFHGEMRIGETLHRRSEILKVSEKSGSTGRMVFVTVGHRLSTPRGLAVEEEQDIVYVAMPERFVPPPPVAAPATFDWAEPVAMDTVRLFRFSAVTFNAHRIHFDLPYATKVEKYPGLVVHGPLQAILLMEAARRHRGGARPAGYRFRGVRPLFHFDALRLIGGAVADGGQDLCTATGEDLVCMQARVSW
jgi:3-methylfumaryl-CoA hydratase